MDQDLHYHRRPLADMVYADYWDQLTLVQECSKPAVIKGLQSLPILIIHLFQLPFLHVMPAYIK